MAYAILNGQIVGPAETYETATIVSGTLQAGETEIVLTSPYIFTDSHIAPYVDEKIYPSAPSKVTTENGSATLTFDSPFEENVEVGVEVLGTKDYATLEQGAIQSVSDRVTVLEEQPRGGSMELLWENSNEEVAFTSKDITLASSDYSALLVFSRQSIGSNYIASTMALKGRNIVVSIGVNTGSVAENLHRKYEYVNGTTLSVKGGYANSSTNDSVCIPVAIYGIK